MEAIWDIYKVAEMTEEQKVRNACRKLRQEVCQWGRSLSYRNQRVRATQELPDGISLILGGQGWRSYAIVCVNEVEVSKRFYVAKEADELYAEIMQHADANCQQSLSS